MTFAAPWFAFLGVAVAAICALYLRGRRRGAGAFAAPRLADRVRLQSTRYSRWAGSVLVAGALASLAVALAQPRWGREEGAAPLSGRDVVVAIDASLSMLAEDTAPNRLDRAKQAARRLAEALGRDGGHRLALVGFSGRASMIAPPTLDYNLFLMRLDSLEAGAGPVQGTRIDAAIRQILDGFGVFDEGYTDIVLIGDGEDHDSVPFGAASEAAARGVAIHTVAVGGEGDGAYIPVPGRNSGRTLLVYRGEPVDSRPRADVLAQIAEISGGIALGVGADPGAMVQLYRDGIAGKPRKTREETDDERTAHRFQWFVALALAFLAVDAAQRAFAVRPGCPRSGRAQATAP